MVIMHSIQPRRVAVKRVWTGSGCWNANSQIDFLRDGLSSGSFCVLCKADMVSVKIGPNALSVRTVFLFDSLSSHVRQRCKRLELAPEWRQVEASYASLLFRRQIGKRLSNCTTASFVLSWWCGPLSFSSGIAIMSYSTKTLTFLNRPHVWLLAWPTC